MIDLPLAVPALPLDEAGKYVAGAYIVFLLLLVVYVGIMAAKVQRIEKELKELAGFAEARQPPDVPGREAEDILTPSEAVGGPGREARDV